MMAGLLKNYQAQAFIQAQELSFRNSANYHYNFKTLNSSSSDNNNNNQEGEQELILSEKEKPIYELLTIVSNSNRIAHTIYDNVHPFTTLLAQIEMMIKMMEELAQTQDHFLGDSIHETINASKELQITVLCRRASCAMVCWRRAQTEEERNQYYSIMEQDYDKAFSFGIASDELDFGFASFCKVVKQDLRQALHYVTRSIESNPNAPIKFLKRAELQFELFEYLKETGENMRVEERSNSTGASNNNGGAPESTAITSFSVNPEWSDEALDTLNNCLIDCERYIEDTIQQAKEHNIKDYYLDYYVYNLRGRVFVESFLSDMGNTETSKIFIANAERDFTLYIDHFKPEQIDNLHPNYISELCSAHARRAMCRLHNTNINPEHAKEDIERATQLLQKISNGNDYSDITNFIEELKVLTHAKLMHNKATELGAKAAQCQQTNPELALEYLNEAIKTCEISPIAMLYIQRAFLNYETFRKQTQAGMQINDPLNREIMDRVAEDCQSAINKCLLFAKCWNKACRT
ncbi:predicted protein [Naegleria gruberi]|uniref:Predicted protein n=1 Tax=Naegleria gruberi TaxID=5762 RepID=D2W0T1_NAEGR|nr:uncharacterized protein NAEGRDRAFT_53801 [Naegleria gruberi]EFC37343.1 predicted protein [Naegleria gruberi]|eukprot:XP_002670087.1 predicted protein [Naegleria gruberi strain NEG-M]